MRYEGPIYRPPSEADSLLIQATVGCPHNKCTFCMIYKKGSPFRVRPVGEICEDLEEARRIYGNRVKTLFFPAGNTIAMPTEDLAAVCGFARRQFPHLERITVYGSSRYIAKKGLQEMRSLAAAGLTRIHVGLESGDDEVLRRVKKGTTAEEQIAAGRLVKDAGIELSEYVLLGLGGLERSGEHALATAKAITARSMRVPCFHAATTPIGTAMKMARNRVTSISESVGSIRCAIIVLTGRLVKIEVPRSPRMMSQTHEPNRTR